jgi:glucokinase
MILAGDIGGTKTHLGIFKCEGNKVISLLDKKYESQNYQSFGKLVQDFVAFVKQSSLTTADKYIGVACFGMAGPVKTETDGQRSCQMTNIPNWPVIKETELSQLLKVEPVVLLNDLEAIGYGISQLSEKDLVELNRGIPQAGNRAVIAAGTGLGQVMLYWDGNEHHPSASEGGHANFAPSGDDELQLDLLRYLRKKYQGKVGFERVLSGPGLENIYDFLRDSGKYGKESAELAKRLDNRAQLISEMALSGKNALCSKALDVFVSIYGATAGDFALHSFAVGGVYIGGGIAPKILEKLRDGTFMQAFKAKEGNSAQLNADIPVNVITNPEVGLLGAAWRGVKT